MQAASTTYSSAAVTRVSARIPAAGRPENPRHLLIPTSGWRSRTTLCQHRSSGLAGRNRAPCLQRGRANRLSVRAKAGEVDVQDRILGALPYVIPLLDGVRYGRYFFLQFPLSAQLLAPIRPLVSIYYSVPFLSLIIFFALYSGVVNNFNLSRFVRYNAMQAVLLSVLLVFPSLLEQVFRPSGGVGLQLQINLYNTVWLFVFASVSYAIGSALVGKAARLPLIADAADQRVL